MRCGRCGKNFDEEMYNGVCPSCGRFNNSRATYDVSKYFGETSGDEETVFTEAKVSTADQAAAQHAKLHEAYDAHDAHKKRGGQHEKLHGMYDSSDPHRRRQDGGNEEERQAKVRKVLVRTMVTFAVIWIAVIAILTGAFGVIIIAVIVWQFVFVRRKMLQGDNRRGKGRKD